MAKTVLRLKRLKGKTGKSTSQIYAEMAKGDFPKPIKLGKRAVGWIEEEVDAYIERRIAERDTRAAA
jgi:prophage regulatory protein